MTSLDAARARRAAKLLASEEEPLGGYEIALDFARVIGVICEAGLGGEEDTLRVYFAGQEREFAEAAAELLDRARSDGSTS